MGWDIKVWHEEVEEKSRLIIEAGQEVPDEVISHLAGVYWLEEIQYLGEEWEEDGLDEPGPMHG